MSEFKIGGSDIPKIMGVSRFGNALSVYAEKLGLTDNSISADDFDAYVRTRLGLALEGVISEIYSRKHPDESVKCLSGPMSHPEYPWWTGSPDRIVTRQGLDFPLEIKTAGTGMAKEFGLDSIPKEYELQVRWYIGLLGAPFGRLVAILGGNVYREYDIERDLEIENEMKRCAERFINEHLIPRRPPEPDHTSASREAIQALSPGYSEEIIPSTQEADKLAEELRKAEIELDELTVRVNELRHKLMMLIGEKAGIVGSWGVITWRFGKPRAITDWPEVAKELKKALKDKDVKILMRAIEKHTRQIPVRYFKTHFE